MTILQSVHRIAWLVTLLGAMGSTSVFAQSNTSVDVRSLSPGARDALMGALNSGDYVSASKLLRSLPASKAKQDFIQPNTDWESLKGCGFYPQATRLECTVELIHITRDTRLFGDYGGPVGGWGSQENVDFCVNIIPVDFNPLGPYHLTVWMPIGRGTVIVHDQRPPASGYPVVTGPWDYAVYRDFDPIAGPRVALNGTTTTQTQSSAFTYEVKATLWWNPPLAGLFGTPPGDDPAVSCTFNPTYGDIKIFQVRGDPIR